MKSNKLLILLVMCSVSAYSQVMPNINSNSNIGLINCPTDSKETSLGYCTYTLKNLNRAQNLIRIIEQTLFRGLQLNPPNGMMETLGNNNKVMTFWHKDPVVLNKMKEIIPILDTKESFYPNTMVEMKLDIYEIAESSLTNIGAEISNLQIGAGLGDLDNSYGVSSADGSGLNVDLKLGVVQLSGLLSAEKQKGKLNRVISIKKAVPNLTSIKYTDSTLIYNAPGAGVDIKQNRSGVSMNGTASVEAGNTGLVNIKGFEFDYGLANEDNTVRIVSSPFETLSIQEGVALPIAISSSNSQMMTSEAGFLGFGKKVSKENARLIIYASVQVKTWEEYVSEIQSILVIGKQKFDKKEISALRNTYCPSDIELLNDLVLKARRDLNGDPLLTLMLSKDKACLQNLKQRVKIRISGEGLSKDDNEEYPTVESIMHIPMRIKNLGLTKYTDKSLLKFKVKLETVKNGVRTKLTKKLFFAPSNYDLEDSFWSE
jgi:hypothetical protein